MHSKFSTHVDFVGIYIVEAHAIDEWPVGDPLSITQPKSSAERCGIAREFCRDYRLQFPLLVDPIDNPFSTTYSAWPVRFYIVQRGTILYVAQPDHSNTYDSILPGVEQVLKDRLGIAWDASSSV